MNISAQTPCEIEIINAALERAKAKAMLEKGHREHFSSLEMYEIQGDIYKADDRIAVAANMLLNASNQND